MIQKAFAAKMVEIVKNDPGVIGLAAGGSWITNELDEYADLDLVLITKDKIAGDLEKMRTYAGRFGNFISGFTGDHVGEPRLLVCLYDDPLLHVDIKFLTLPEFYERVENPVILFEREGQLSAVIHSTLAEWPITEYQWIEDRFWTWVHYIAAKAGRGEFFECLDGLGFIRGKVLAPLLQIKNKKQPRGLRKVEMQLNPADLAELKSTVAQYSRDSVFNSLDHTVHVYRQLRQELFSDNIEWRIKAEQASTNYLQQIKEAPSKGF